MSWIAVGIGAAVGAGSGAIIGSQKGGDDVWKDALLGGTIGAVTGGAGGALFGGGAAAAEGAGGTALLEGGAGTGLVEGGAGALEGGTLSSIPGITPAAGVFESSVPATLQSSIPGAVVGGPGIAEGAFGSALPTGAAALPGGEAFGGGLQSIAPQVAETGASNLGGATQGLADVPNTADYSMLRGELDMSSPNLPPLDSSTSTDTVSKAGSNLVNKTKTPESFLDKYGTKLAFGAGTLGLGALLNQDQKKYGVPAQTGYTGPLSKLHYDPARYTPTQATPNVYTAHYAQGGIAALAGGGDPMNPMNNPIYPQSQQDHTQFATSTQYPNSMKSAMAADYDTRTDPETGQELPMGMAGGGIASLGSYSDGGQLLRGPGDGVSDSIPASIGRKQPARLADGEFVVPARAVSELGNGSTEAGAKQLYSMLDRIQNKRKKGKGLAYQSSPKKMLPA